MRKRLTVWILATAIIAVFIVILVDYVSDQSYPAAWVARYNGPPSGHDEAHALAIDGSGNAYVTGASTGIGTFNDYTTVKYDPGGKQIWVARYDGPTGGHDKAYAIAVDDSDNIYVTGESEGDGTSYDYATIKYDSAGNQVWVARFDGPAGRGDGASAIALDDSGNVYVTGYSAGNGADYATIKYDRDGNQLWVARYNGPRSTGDYPNDMITDSLGNIYVTGRSSGNGTSNDYATVKYDADGNELWVARYNGPASLEDEANAIAIDGLGNVYVTGFASTASFGSDSNRDCATVKYDADGNQLWVARYNVEEGNQAQGNSLVVDDEGNVYVTGNSIFTVNDYTSSDAATIKYDSDGNELWVSRYDSPERLVDGANAIALDGSGNTYIAGPSVGIGNENNYVTVKYNADGKELWFARYNGPDDLSDSARAIAIDHKGNVYVTGFSFSKDASSDYVTIKYSQ
jgi:hypothetical protein